MFRVLHLLLVGILPGMAQGVTSGPMGFNRVTCLDGSDTIVGVPFRFQGSLTSSLVAAPSLTGDAATLALSATNLAVWATETRYLKFASGAKAGRYYAITSNTADSVTIDLNGDAITGSAPGDSVVIAEYWTLDTLFPPAGATTAWTETPAASGNWVQNGHAIMASTSTLATGRRTEVWLPNVVSSGTNLPPEGRYYIHGGLWKRNNSGNANYGGMKLHPDTLFTISHPATVSHPTVFGSSGEVETGAMLIPLHTREAVAQDNYIAVPRPVNLTLEQLNLRQSGAFMASTSTLATGRRDQLLVYDNELQLRNKAPSAIYYVHNGIWKLNNGGATDRGSVVIPAAAGFIVRKYPVVGQPTSFWNHLPVY